MVLPSASIAPEQVAVFTTGSYSDSQVPSSGLGEKAQFFFIGKNQNVNHKPHFPEIPSLCREHRGALKCSAINQFFCQGIQESLQRS